MKINLTIEECAKQFELYAKSHSSPDSQHSLRFCANFLRKFCSQQFRDKNPEKCGDCGVFEGQYHVPGCDTEVCPFCGGQLISCGCSYKHFYPDTYDTQIGSNFEPVKEFFGLPEEVYTNGHTEKQKVEWDRILKEKGLIPFIRYPNICARCGKLWPDMYRVPDEDWQIYVEPSERHKMLCEDCFHWIKKVIDSNVG